MKAKRKLRKVETHLWAVTIRHRDYVATMNSSTPGRPCMRKSQLWITSPQSPGEKPDIELSLRRTKSFMHRNRRQYAIATIEAVEYHGTIDR